MSLEDPQGDATMTLREAHALVDHAGQAVAQQDLGESKRCLDQVSAWLEERGRESDPELNILRARLYDGYTVVAGRSGDLTKARHYHALSLALRDELSAASESDLSIPIAISVLNFANILAAGNELEEAEAVGRDALRRLEQSPESSPTYALLTLSTYQLLASVSSTLDKIDQTREFLVAFVALGRQLEQDAGDALPTQVSETLVQGLMRLSLLHYEQEELEQAIRVAQDAASRADALFSASGSQSAMTQYLSAQLNLITFCEASGAFGAGEDALFRALEIVGPYPDLIKRGEDFYRSLLQLSDEELRAGNLPRTEILDSLQELQAMEESAR